MFEGRRTIPGHTESNNETEERYTKYVRLYNPKENQLRYEFVFLCKTNIGTRNFTISCSHLKRETSD